MGSGCRCCVVCISTLLAQISLDVSLVTLVATVSDRSGRSVPDLGQSDFIVIEDGKEQKISLVEQSNDLPLSIGVLLDASYSMEPKIQTATTAIDRFLQSLGPDDDIFLMSFAAKPKLEQNFTNDRNKISKALHKVKLGNRTALYDTIEQGIQKIRDGKHEKKALLLVTDGQDTISRIRLDQAMKDVRQSHVLLYCLGIGSNFNSWRGGPPMIRLPGGILIPLPGPARQQFPSGGAGRPGGQVSWRRASLCRSGIGGHESADDARLRERSEGLAGYAGLRQLQLHRRSAGRSCCGASQSVHHWLLSESSGE